MIIQGRFIGNAPFFAVQIRSRAFSEKAWMLADTGASRTTLLDRDLRLLGMPIDALTPLSTPMTGIGGSVRTFLVKNVEIVLASDQGDVVFRQDLCVAYHDLERLPPEEASRILRLPSVLGRDLLNQLRFLCDFHSGAVRLERPE